MEIRSNGRASLGCESRQGAQLGAEAWIDARWESQTAVQLGA